MRIGPGPNPRGERILVFVPMYNCAPQIPRALQQFDVATQSLVDEILVVDNRSQDNGVAAAQQALANLRHVRTTLVRNVENYGLGGSHKVAFNYALDHGYDYVIVLHGDDQARVADLVPYLRGGAHRECDQLLGARFGQQSRLVGYSRLRTWGNHVFNGLFSLACGRWLADLGSGLNMYAMSALRDRDYLRYADDLTFNYYAILTAAAGQARLRFVPISWREEDQRSNVKMTRQALRMCGILAQFVFSRRRFLTRSFSLRAPDSYRYEPVWESASASRHERSLAGTAV
ncbi:MAG: glycosyltransferase family 2 protein [Planctomycetia bacterium]|nr:glycosyltransferase family 2 protein [Planctomycetia bacterium]